MDKAKYKRLNIVVISICVLMIIAALIFGYNIIVNNKSSNTHNKNEQSINEQLKDPSVNVDIPSPIISLSAGEDESVVASGTPITITCQGNASYSCNIVIKSNNSSQVINFPTQAIVDNGKGQSSTSWKWTAISGEWTLTSYLSNSQGEKSLSPSIIIKVQ